MASNPRLVMAAAAVLIAAAALFSFQRTVARGADSADRLLRALQAAALLDELSERLVRAQALVQLLARGRAPADAGQRISDQVQHISRQLEQVESLALVMPPAEWAVFNRLKQHWSQAQVEAWQLIQLPPLSQAAEGLPLAKSFQGHGEHMQEYAASLARMAETQQAGELSGFADWRGDVKSAAWRLLIGVVLLGCAIGWIMGGGSFAVPGLPFVQRLRKPALPKGRGAADSQPLEQIEEQV